MNFKAQRKLGTINIRKINNHFRFTDNLLSLNDGSTFEKYYKDIYPIELELKEENNRTSCASFLDIHLHLQFTYTFTFTYTFILKMENSLLNYLTNKINLALRL